MIKYIKKLSKLLKLNVVYHQVENMVDFKIENFEVYGFCTIYP